ncbi:MAG TPA: hypothetical protein VHA30_03350, partial [Patescibacteria group bacterium]|nr:hypothetical protein [Patescibacteria group bacterium]
ISICQSGSSCVSLYVSVSGSGSCYYGNCGGNLSLSQSSVNLNVGQSANVTVYSQYGGSYYVSSNSNSSVVSASPYSNTLTLYGLATGSSTLTICSNTNGGCATLYVTVGGGYGGSSLSLSQNSVNLNLGQSANVNIYGSGSYYVSSNSNSSVASASISGSTIYLLANGNGSTTITVCQNSYSACATLYVYVGSGSGSGNLSLSQTSLSLSAGQTGNVTAYSYSGYGLYISSNSNSSVASASVSGNTISVYALNSGSSTIVICSNGNYGCANLFVSVSGNGNGNCYYGNCGGNLSLSQTSLYLNSGQTGTVTIYGSGSYYVSSNSNSGVATANVYSNTLSVYGNYTGTTTITVCQSGGACGTVYVSVNSGGYYGGSSSISFNPASLNLSAGQSQTVSVYGGSGNYYYVSSNSNPAVVSAQISGSSLTVYANAQTGSATITVCQSGYSSCGTLYVTVSSNYNYPSGGGLTYPGGSVLGARTYPDGALISEGSTVYIVYKDTKTGFVSGSVFTTLGYSFKNVVPVGNSGLPDSGYTVVNPYAAHPWGTWIKSGQTVYLVGESGLIPVPDWNTFLNNGGQAAWIVPANAADMRLSVLAPMTYNDSRI